MKSKWWENPHLEAWGAILSHITFGVAMLLHPNAINNIVLFIYGGIIFGAVGWFLGRHYDPV